MIVDLDFFKNMAPDYCEIAKDIVYDSEIDLNLKFPESKIKLKDLGYNYSHDQLALTQPFKIFSERGLKKINVLTEAFKNILPDSSRPQKIRTAIYQSQFFREFTRCETLRKHITSILGRDVIQCSFIIQRAHLNFSPIDKKKEIVAWHTDTLDYSLAILLNSEDDYVNGEYEYYKGTKESASKYINNHKYNIPDELTALQYHKQGHGILARGDKVLHRVRPLLHEGERITLVTSFLDAYSYRRSDSCTIKHLKAIDQPNILRTTWLKHKSYRAANQLLDLCENIKYDDEKSSVLDSLKNIEKELKSLIKDIEDIGS